MPELPPLGWYQDPEGMGWRWWDGSQWTEHWEADAAATTKHPAQASRDRLGLALVGVGGLLALIGIFLIVIAAIRFI